MATGFRKAPLFLLLLLAATHVRGEEAPARRMGIIFGGTFENFEVTGQIEGSKKTRMAAHYEWDYGVRAFTRATWDERGLTWEPFYQTARQVADGIAERLKPKLVRDHRGVVLYAIIADEDPFLTSALLSPKLHERFKETLGDRIQVLLLERNRIYLFPATGGTLEEFGPALVEEYRRASYPVSLEIFLLDRDGFRVVGELERPGAVRVEDEKERLITDTPAKP